jgi:hypothetical protein
MPIRTHTIMLAALLIASTAKAAQAQAQAQTTTASASQPCSALEPSLGRVLCESGDHSVHILYIHGIGATKADDSLQFRKSLCHKLIGCDFAKDQAPVGPPEYADGGDFAANTPPDYRYMGSPIWYGPDDWKQSRPFVNHYVMGRAKGAPIIVDEINWWPLVLPLKCRKILQGEAYLAGPNKDLLELCAGHVSQKPGQQPIQPAPFAWISSDEAQTLESRPRNAARFNGDVKTNLLDWGFSDPMMAVGPMKELFVDATNQLFVKSVAFRANGTSTKNWAQRLQHEDTDTSQFVVVSHSLGSFLVFSTLTDRTTDKRCEQLANSPPQPANDAAQASSAETQDRVACYIQARTSIVYFFANQVPLLYLATVVAPSKPETSADLSEQIQKLQAVRKYYGKTEINITSFSDPSDLLTFQFPAIQGAIVKNCHVRNTFWRWLIAPPSGAHVNYAQNNNVIAMMLKPESHQRSCSTPE